MLQIRVALFLQVLVVQLLLKISAVPLEVNGTIVQEVPIGKTVTLKCQSNDNDHNFLYWHVDQKNTVVGPANEYDKLKFNFEVLSGNLTIKAVSPAEAGKYNCVSRGVRKNDYCIRSVRMIVTKDWEEVYETDSGVNLFRIVVIIGTLAILAGFGFFIYKIWKDRFKHPSYLVPSDDEEDDSAEEIFRAPSTSKSGNIVLNKQTNSFDGPGISTDFKSILETVNNK